MCLIGAVYGTLLVNAGKTLFSESFPELWLFLMGALFIGVVMAFPNGLSGMYSQLKEYIMEKYFSTKNQSSISVSKNSIVIEKNDDNELADIPAGSVTDKGV